MSMHKIEYVLGFMFNDAKTKVVLIEKRKPKSQAGYLNGVGGKIETSDVDVHHLPSNNAMVREFREETGVRTAPDDWRHFSTLEGSDWIVYCFVAFNTLAVEHASTTTDEIVVKVPLIEIPKTKVLSNLHWLIPMSLDENMGNPYFIGHIFY